MSLSYAIDYQTPRETIGLSRNDVADLLIDKGVELSIESLGCYERGVREPSPAIVKELSDIYKAPFLTQRYCKYNCKIGQAYSYDILENVDLSLSNIYLKLVEEITESYESLDDLSTVIVNKKKIEDFTDTEVEKLKLNTHNLLDTEHAIETFKIALNQFINMEDLIQEHNQKCRDKGYSRRA